MYQNYNLKANLKETNGKIIIIIKKYMVIIQLIFRFRFGE